ncbi:ecotin [Sphingobacterium psychroaquaticum]|uniref:Ecotin n=2 Tax=Sphingobacterium psychroaquaticum TaxID=561061 RepID=A0A1X7KIQ0_9SPHI|nr:ecotin [Sphingobacterium psychroaquaticum]
MHMKKKIVKGLGVGLLLAFIGFNNVTMAQSTIIKQDPSIFPKPEAGYKQMVIEVPHSDNDNNKKIEFTIGKMMEVDKCNTHRLQGSLEEKPLEGWGYNYYVFKSNGGAASTLMACPDNERVLKFVSAGPTVTNYNGRLPIVIYVPEGYDVQFRIFKAEDDIYRAAEVRQKK